MAQKCGLSGVFPALCLLLLAVYAQGLQMCPSLSCPTPVGFFAHPTNCDSYVKCSHGAVTIKQCPEGLDYNPEMRRCDYPQLAQCNITARLMKSGCSLKPSNKPVLLGSAESSESSGSSGSSGSSVECDCDCCLMPHEVCTKYYECLESGEAVERECSDGLVFNPDIENCDFPSNYQCPPPVCECDCRYPVEGECNAFYDCKDGEPEKKYCPDGLFFNPETNVCGLYCHQTTPRPPTTTTTPQPTTTTTTTTTPQPTTTTTTTTTPEPITTTTTTTPQPTTTTTTTTTPEPTTTTTTTTTPEPTTTTTTTTTPEPTTTTTTTPEPTTTTTPEPTTTTTPEPTTTSTTTPEPTTTTTTPEPTTTTTTPEPTTTTTPEPTTTTTPEPTTTTTTTTTTPEPTTTSTTTPEPTTTTTTPEPTTTTTTPEPTTTTTTTTTTPEPTTTTTTTTTTTPEPTTTTTTTTTTPEPTTTTTTTTKAPDTTTGGSVCDIVCSSPQGLFPHPQNCNKWVHCDHNIAHVKDCPPGLHFNPQLKICDWPQSAGCISSPEESCTMPTVIPTTPTTNATEPTIDPLCDCACCHKPAEDCTAYYYCDENHSVSFHKCSEGLVFDPELETCVFAAMYPECVVTEPPVCHCDCFYPAHDCSSYYYCKEDVPVKYDCPAGLYWNQDKKSCDLPEYVTGNCVPPTTTTTKKPTPSTTPVTPSTTTASPFTCVDCSRGQQFFQHPTDCTKYIQCAPFGPQEMSCPEHMVWDQGILTCNYETSTPCVTGNHVDSNGNCVRPTTTTSTTTSTTTTTTTKAPVTTTGGSVCDIVCSSPQGLFPHPQNCNKWVHCDHNIAHVKDCPADLHFNPQLKVCDWPQSAGCTSSPEESCTMPTVIPTTPTTNATEPTIDPLCDCACCHKPAEDCTAYYYCDENHSVSFHKCSEGLVFDPELETCVFAAMYPECVVTEPPVCHCDCFYPAHDCSSYYYCKEDVPVKYDCPAGLYWNQDKKSCDLPEYVTGNCVPPTTTTTKKPTPSTTPVTPSTTTASPFTCVDCSRGQQFFQHPTDCTKYIQCAPFGPQEMSCPEHKVWDQGILTCNYETSTPCVTGNHVDSNGNCVRPTTTTSTTTTTTTTTTPEPTTTTTTTTTPEPTTTTTPEPTTTTTTTTTTTPKPTTTTTPEPTTTTTTTTPEPTTTTTSGCDIACPAAQGLFPHPQKCGKWVHCDHNIPYVKDCPAGLHFNPLLKVCDWPQSAGCTSGPDHICEIPTPAPTTPAPNATQPTPNPMCDCECCHKPADDCTSYYYCDEDKSMSYHKCSEGLVFHPDFDTCVYADMYPECIVTEPPPVCLCDCYYPSEVCSSYYDCVEGVPVKLDCPEGLYWNQDKKSCDLPQFVNCTMPIRH